MSESKLTDLLREAFGLERLGKHPAFGALAQLPFQAVLEELESGGSAMSSCLPCFGRFCWQIAYGIGVFSKHSRIVSE